MDFSDFDRSFDKLRTILKDMISDNKNAEKLEIYGSYLDYRREMKVIVQRIETETQKHVMLTQKILKALQEEKEIDDEWSIESLKNLIRIRLDVKSFFIFTRIFLDILARIVKLCYGKKGDQLSYRMSRLLKSKKCVSVWMTLDYEFYKGLKDRMLWMNDFVKSRVEIEHYLGSMRSTQTKDGKFGFDILGLRTHRSWGTHTVKSITDYVSNTLTNLSEVISYIHDKLTATK